MPRLKIDLVCRFGPATPGGTQKVVGDLAVAVSAHHDVRVLAGRCDEGGIEWRGLLDRVAPWPDRPHPGSGAPVCYYGLSSVQAVLLAPYVFSPRWERPWAYTIYRRLLERTYPTVGGAALAHYHRGRHVVHRFGGSKLAAATVRGARRAGVPVIVSPYAHRGQWDDDRASARAYRAADLVVAASPEDRQLYSDLGVAAERLVIGPHMVGAPEPGSGEQVRRRYGLPGPVVLFVGSNRPYKGVDLFLAVASDMARQRPEVRFVVLGARDLDASGMANVLSPGYVSEAEKSQWLDCACLLVLPSARESYGLVVDEAWAAGVPVVTSDIPALAKRVERAGAGLCVPRDRARLGEAIATLLDDDARRAALGRAGRSHWRQHMSPGNFATWWCRTYEEVAALGGRAGTGG